MECAGRDSRSIVESCRRRHRRLSSHRPRINPSGAPVQSEQYLIEIGKSAQIADAGFSLPTEEKKYAISQQMVIYRTEQLLKRPAFAKARRGRLRISE